MGEFLNASRPGVYIRIVLDFELCSIRIMNICEMLQVHNGRLRRTAPVMHIGQEGNLTMSDTSSVQSVVQSENNLWSNDGILVWPDELPSTRHSRQSSDSSTSTRFLYDR